MQSVKVYTDGACKGNPGKGGWAAILISGAHVKEISGGLHRTTNNEMELMAIIEAIEILKYAEDNPANITIFTDSLFAIKAITGEFKKLKATHIIDLVTYIRELIKTKGHNVSFEHVKGHSGDPMNERVDLLASKTAELQTNFIRA